MVSNVEIAFMSDDSAPVVGFAGGPDDRIGILAAGRCEHELVCSVADGWEFPDCLAPSDEELLTQAVSYPL